ncbi:MAG TPA: toxin-antitoxin system YwqK family antitoxin [Chitinophagaceae bacterium]|nr:toxin-antitoxin system YwqK family antitoxin [Chitinophagaceae bacterium]
MMKFCFIFLSLFYNYANSQKLIPKKTYYDNYQTELKEVYSVIPGSYPKIEGIYKLFNRQARLIKVCNYRNGKIEGGYTEYHDDGSIRVKCFYKDNLPEGKYVEFNSNGSIAVEANFINGREQGISKVFYSNGILFKEAEMKDGTKHGNYSEFYENGKIRYNARFVNNKKEGFFKEYFPDGKVSFEGVFQNDKMNGAFKKYFPGGNLFEETNFKNDIKDGMEKLYTEGKSITVTNVWTNGTLLNDGSVNLSGNSKLSDSDISFFEKLINGTQYGFESNWIDLVEEDFKQHSSQVLFSGGTLDVNNPRNAQNEYLQKKFDERVTVKYKFRRRFDKPDKIFIDFLVKSIRDTSYIKSYFAFFNITLINDDRKIFDDFYNFGITKLGKRFNSSTFYNNGCQNPQLMLKIASENPNPEFDEDPVDKKETIIRARAGPINVSRYINERDGGGFSHPLDGFLFKIDCISFNKFIQLIKIASVN